MKLKDSRWFFCSSCQTVAYHFECCGNISCNAGGCDDCMDRSEVDRRVDEGDHPPQTPVPWRGFFPQGEHIIGDLRVRDVLSVKKVESREVEVYIDGEKVDTLRVVGALHLGMTLDSDAIDQALQGRTVINIFFTGEVVNVVTEPEES